jgi:hypothetical protein
MTTGDVKGASEMSDVTIEGAVELLGEALSGPVLSPRDPGYEAVRRVHNGLIDRHPAIIARCVHTADVVDAVRFGRSEGWRSRCAAAATTSPAGRSPTVG